MYEQDIILLPIFDGFNKAQIDLIKSSINLCRFSEGLVIFEQGNPAVALYILFHGEVLVEYKPYDGPPLTVAHILPGGVFGWSAALGRKNYTSSAITLVASDAGCITCQNLHSIYEKDPETGGILIERFAGVVAEREGNSNPEILSLFSEDLDLNVNSRRIFGNDK